VRAIVRERGPGMAVAMTTLGHWDEPENLELLLNMLVGHGSSSELRDVALEALCTMEAPEALDFMCKALTDDTVDRGTRCACAYAAGAIGNWAALPALEAAAKANEGSTLGSAARDAIVAIRSGADAGG
jgi:HEAT repeat protein